VRGGGQHYAPAALHQRNTWYLLYRRLGGPQRLSGWVQKISFLSGFNPWTTQPVASRYTDYTITAPINKSVSMISGKYSEPCQVVLWCYQFRGSITELCVDSPHFSDTMIYSDNMQKQATSRSIIGTIKLA
jgi:hypothetical protein